jgi:hypothetical protein
MDLSTISDLEIANDSVIHMVLKKDGMVSPVLLFFLFASFFFFNIIASVLAPCDPSSSVLQNFVYKC